MADENVATPEAETFTKDKVEEMIKNRLRKHMDEKTQLMAENEALKAQNGAAAPAAPSAPAQTPSAPPGPQGLTPEAFQEGLQENNKRLQEQMSVMQAKAHYQNTVQRMVNEDEKFKKLTDGTNSLGVPEAVGIHIVNAISPEKAKNVLTKLLSDEGMNNKMRVEYMEGRFNEYLSKLLTQNPTDPDAAPASVPDLSNQSVKEGLTPNYDNLDNYLNR